MKKQKRITAAFDSSTVVFLEKISAESNLSYSEVIRRALDFYEENKSYPKEKVAKCMDLLSNEENVVIDVDYWLLFLDFVQASQNQELFWVKHREIAHSLGELLKGKVRTLDDLLNRLELCNFFKVTKNSQENFTLILSSVLTKKFVMIFLEEFLSALGVKAEIKQNLSKITIRVIN